MENGHDSKLYWELENYTRNNYSVDANFSGAIVVSRLDIVCRVRVVVFNATFKNISVISRRSVLLVEETGVPR